MSEPTARPIAIEAAVDCLAAASAAQAAGADRLELCGDLGVGGVTPSAELQREARRSTRLPLYTMIRPRAGHFVYSAAEVGAMLDAIAQARELGASGIVTGALDADGGIDVEATRQLVQAARPLPVTFHKAFDVVTDLAGALELLAGIGVDRVLTSGGAPTAGAGTAALARLVRQAGDRLGIVAGGGVSGAGVEQLVRETGVTEVHARCEADGTRIRGIVAALRKAG